MFRSKRVLRIICFEPFFLAFNPGSCPQSHTGQGFSSCVFSCQRAKKSIVLGRFPFQFELWFFLIWSWSIPVGASETRCSTRVFAVSKTASTDHGRHESTKCEQDSKCRVSKRNLGFESLTLRQKPSHIKAFAHMTGLFFSLKVTSAYMIFGKNSGVPAGLPCVRQSQDIVHYICRGNLGLVIQMTVNIRRRADVAVAQPLLDLLQRHIVCQKQ